MILVCCKSENARTLKKVCTYAFIAAKSVRM